MSDGMGRELAYLSSHATNRYFIPNWGRGYKAIGPGEKEWENNEKRKDWAPHDFWYDFFGGASMLSNGKFSIEWIDEPDETPGYAEPMHRINIDDNRLWGFKRVEKL